MPEANALSPIPTKILVPIDFSPSSHAALESAADLAQHFGAAIHLVHVIPMFPATTFPDFIPETKFLEAAKGEADRHFAAAAADLKTPGMAYILGRSHYVENFHCTLPLKTGLRMPAALWLYMQDAYATS